MLDQNPLGWVLLRYRNHTSRGHSALRRMGVNGEFNFRGRNPVKIRCCQYLNNVVEQDHRRVKGRLSPDVGIQDVLQCATRHYRHRTGADDSQTPVRNSDPMAVESRPNLASCDGRIVRIAVAHSWSYRSDNPIYTRTRPEAERLMRHSGDVYNSNVIYPTSSCTSQRFTNQQNLFR